MTNEQRLQNIIETTNTLYEMLFARCDELRAMHPGYDDAKMGAVFAQDPRYKALTASIETMRAQREAIKLS